ncbi:MAG: TonB-dependent receptor [Candidatus Eisenbacteria bacterium]|uniref:TonB-dependent receptor n=1 Tax=Eiseniibacteriota bacterium TaxID=2212470 RepID=A0A933W2B8_UNCEI|nr:TonB-dependent receptor [Candidatus Eisenbacteria bacterium]
MDRRSMGRGLMRVLVGAALLAAVWVGAAVAGTTGKITGKVTGARKEPLAGVTVRIAGMPLGGITDESGRFMIINVPSGKVEVKAGLIGYGPVSVQNVDVAADNTTRLDIEMKESVVGMAETIVSARRPVVEIHRTSNIATVNREQMQALPVQELQDIVNLQAGVVDGHFRGGRTGEVQYQVDGVSVNNAYNNSSTLKLDRSLLEEVQVISGTFDAEYGQAMSGVVNAVLKRGTEQFHWDAELFSGGPFYPGSDRRLVDFRFRPASQQNYQVTAHGPTRLPKTTYLVSARHYLNDEWVWGERRFRPGDSSDVATLQFRPTGDGARVPLGETREWSGITKLTNRSFANLEFSWQAILNVTDARALKYAYRLNPDGASKQRTISLVQGMDFTHTLTTSRFYTLSARQNYFHYRDFAYESVWDPHYDDYGPVRGASEYENGAIVQGVDFTRFRQKTNGAVLKGSYVDQLSKERQLKVGAEFQAPHVSFGVPGYLRYGADTSSGGAERLMRVTEYSPEYPGVREYRPFLGAAFAQEEIEWNDLTVRAGARFEYFDARSYLPSDLSNPANSISGVPQSHDVRTTAKYSVAPRIGVSYPIHKNAALFFAYGHFYQFPGLGQIFEHADYDELKDLQAGETSPTMGNPDIKPERTVQYQFGYKHAINEFLGLDVTTFFKDIRDLLGVEFVETYNGAQYSRLTNVDFGDVIGFTVSVNQRGKGLFSSTVDYTWQSAQGNSSDPRETAARAAGGEDPRPRSVPFNWDQKHTLNVTMTLAKPQRFNVSTAIRIASGQPYTPEIETGFGGGLEANSGRKPMGMVVDLRGSRAVELFGIGCSAFGRVFNLTDTRAFNGFVFANSGSPYYSRFPVRDAATLADPTRFYGPRRVELGLTLNVAN